jgi:hypothetical protein
MYAPRPAAATSKAATSEAEATWSEGSAKAADSVQVRTRKQETRADAMSAQSAVWSQDTRGEGVTGYTQPAISRQDFRVSAGKVTAQGVTVEQVKVGPGIGHIVVDRSRGVQIGDGNRQVNKFRFRAAASSLLSGLRATPVTAGEAARAPMPVVSRVTAMTASATAAVKQRDARAP